MIIDSHMHVWDRTVSDYDWITDDLGPLLEVHTPERNADALARCGVDQVVLVQAEDSATDTAYMLDMAHCRLPGALATSHPTRITGVVGWAPLDDPAATTEHLEGLLADPLVKGVRHLIHRDPRAEQFLCLDPVHASLDRVAEAGLTLDLPDAWPWFAGDVAATARRHPDLIVVIDHLAKPPSDPDAWDAWARCLRESALVPTTVVKLSGLHLDGIPYTADALRPSFEVALEAFGPDRMMFGGDWPMTRLADDYVPTFEVLAELIGSLSDTEAEAVWSGTAARTYRLPLPA
ncbi:amidohydrolase [uncultured Serinicoccus sp.]|uniref:amidohydrolase family protein n=1 Tax=uncultured Serinicoccus sp. TaxID=735514 RepID=UPI002632972E|nr:amidohydrolase family protein [uncultured Serinicoccus sp.]